MSVVTGDLVTCGLDWMTLTQTIEDNGVMDNGSLFSWACSRLAGQQARIVKWQGYRGLLWGSEKIGQRYRDGKIDVQYTISGQPAGDLIKDNSADILNGLVTGWRVTRVDTQVTLLLASADQDLVARYYDVSQSARDMGIHLSGRRKQLLYRSPTGDTLYTGMRTSGSIVYRLYDKSLDCESNPGSTWRFEIEYGRRYAKSALELWIADGWQERLSRISNHYRNDCGVWPETGVEHLFLPTVVERELQAYSAKDIEGKLAWLRKTSAPAIRRLLSAGACMADVYDAVGLRMPELENDWEDEKMREVDNVITFD